jgi:hypothetical protein
MEPCCAHVRKVEALRTEVTRARAVRGRRPREEGKDVSRSELLG